jgi:hypothetical protein
MSITGIKTTDALRGVRKHHLDRISETNKDIDPAKKELNIHLIESNDSYLKKVFEVIEPMKKEHDKRMKTMHKDRVKSFEAKINSAKNDVACEFLFASLVDRCHQGKRVLCFRHFIVCHEKSMTFY